MNEEFMEFTDEEKANMPDYLRELYEFWSSSYQCTWDEFQFRAYDWAKKYRKILFTD